MGLLDFSLDEMTELGASSV